MLRSFFSPSRFANRIVSGRFTRKITASSQLCVKQMPSRPPPIIEDDITEAFLKGSGPGGQKIVSQELELLLSSQFSTLQRAMLL
jgi:hypothetical protein